MNQKPSEQRREEEGQVEVRSNASHIDRALFTFLREHFERELPPLPDKDLEAVAEEEGAQPLEAFLTELDE